MSYFFFYFLIGRFTIKMVDSTLCFDRIVKYSIQYKYTMICWNLTVSGDFDFFNKKTTIVYFQPDCQNLSILHFQPRTCTFSFRILYFQSRWYSLYVWPNVITPVIPLFVMPELPKNKSMKGYPRCSLS